MREKTIWSGTGFGALGSGLRGLQRVSEKTRAFFSTAPAAAFLWQDKEKRGPESIIGKIFEKRRSLTAPPKVYFVLG